MERALDRQPDLRTLIVAGGVAANTLLRERMAELMRRRDGKFLAPSPALCTDNAAMTAYAGWLLGGAGFYHDLRMEAIPRGRVAPEDMLRHAGQLQSEERRLS